MKICITGGNGFVGSCLLGSLVSTEPEVHALIRTKTAEIPGVTYTIGSVSDRNTLDTFLAGADVLINLIGRFYPPYEDLVDTNVRIPSVLYDVAGKRGVKRIIHVSAAAVYGHVMDSELPTEASAVMPSTLYAWTKLFGEQTLRYLAGMYGITYVILRPTNIYGAGSHSGAMHAMLDSYMSNNRMSVTGDGMQSRDFLHVNDLVQAILSLLRSKNSKGEYNVASGEIWTMKDLALHIQSIGGKTSQIIMNDAAPEHVRTLRADAGLLRRDTHWKPTHDLDTYIKEVLAV